VAYYNEQRLHSALGYVTPRAMLDGRRAEIFEDRTRKLTEARQARRQAQRQIRERVA
jgi:hypothetical protein